ncbi:hypothetical protein Dsin_010612 [Dipteronia sinensis]|uniref:Uncharacterized protein n=1 Tax=Dipteronia sinensis TaxID=43782 RepID=A0AAE0AU11_9ROSI|nr:hypothetical protein Dsin_010612 [Dipteronia sinensis]
MAAGRHGGYRDNEFRDRESEFDVSKREFAYSKEKYECERERIRNGNHENNERGQVRHVRDRIRVRQRDIKEREVTVNGGGGYRSSSSRSNSGGSGSGSGSRGTRHREHEHSVRALDREPGELSSESGSDDAIESESKVKDNEVSDVVENGTRTPLEKKRKFSPIVWDRDDNEASKSRNSPIVTALPPPPPLPKSYRKSPNVVPEGVVHISSLKNRKIQNLQSVSPINPPVASRSVPYAASESPAELDASPSKEQQLGNDHEVEQLDDEDYAPTRNISSSRWAAGNSSPIVEGEILDDEEMPRKRKKTVAFGVFTNQGTE